MDVLKYVPRVVRRKVKKSFARRRIRKEMSGVENIVRLYEQRDAAIDSEASALEISINLVNENAELKTVESELREKIVTLEEDYKKISDAKNEFKKAARKVKEAKQNHLATILTGINNHIEPADFGKYGINEALVRVTKDTRSELESLKERYDALIKDSLAGIVEGVCISHGAKRLPLFVYHKGEMMYESPRFNKMTYNTRHLTTELENNPEVKKRIEVGKKSKMEYANGKVFFIPEKLRNGEVISIAYYVPSEDGKVSSTFAKYGGRTVKAIYKTLKSFDKSGLDFVKNGKK